MNNPPLRPFLGLLLLLLLLAALMGCSATEEVSQTIDLTDKRTAVRVETDTVEVERIEYEPIFLPGQTITRTVPETVFVAQARPDTLPSFALRFVSVDSASVRLSGQERDFALAAPCLGQRLIGRFEDGDMRFYVEGQCAERDTTITVEIEKESWLEKALDKAGMYALLAVLIAVAGYVFRGVIVSSIKAMLPF